MLAGILEEASSLSLADNGYMQHTLVGGNHVRVQLLHYAQPQVILSCRDVHNEQIIQAYTKLGLHQGGLVFTPVNTQQGCIGMPNDILWTVMACKQHRHSMVRRVGDLLG